LNSISPAWSIGPMFTRHVLI